MNNIDLQYQKLCKEILDYGFEKNTRNGKVLSIFGATVRHHMGDGFPLLTTKKMAWKTIVIELLWFLRGDTNIKFLHDNDCHIWDGDYEKSGRTDGELGPIYGKQWRKWNNGYDFTDQIQNLISELKTNPDSRRLMVSAWNVGELDQMVLPPCHYGFQVYTRELSLEERLDIFTKSQVLKEYEGEVQEIIDMNNTPKRAISLMWNQRSVDVPLGLPFNIASYGLLLEMLAKEVNMIPEMLIGNLGDCHIYENQIDGIEEQLTREPFELPKLIFNPIFLANLEHKSFDEAINGQVDFQLENYQSHPAIKMPLSN